MAVGGILYQGLVVHADGLFVADLEMGGGVVRALRMARSDAAEAAYAADAVPIPLLRALEPELEVLPEAVFGQGYAAFAVDEVDDRAS